MYKVLLCWRYLKTRYLALACIISVMLGVATLIVVNSVMSGFSTKLKERLHLLLSDVVIESASLDGFSDPDGKMAKIRKDPFLGPRIEAMAPTLEVFAMLQFRYPDGRPMTRLVHLVGVEPKSRAAIGGFSEYLVSAENKANPTFDPPAKIAEQIRQRQRAANDHQQTKKLLSLEVEQPNDLQVAADELPAPAPPPEHLELPRGAILGKLIASYKWFNPETKKLEDQYILIPGDMVSLTTLSGQTMKPVNDTFVVTDYFQSDMSEYDSQYVYVPLDYLQRLRTMQDRVTSIQIKLRDYGEAKAIVARLKDVFAGQYMYVNTWEDKQGAILQAISIEKGILNILLFMIIAVAGFGILAIFSMIVSEKTRDIGILKALGSHSMGVLNIFLGYGLLLGVVGALLGTVLGVCLTMNINAVETFLSTLTGQELFDRKLYYFDKIPTDIQLNMLLMVNLGSIAIAVIFSILPALRAAWLHPVRALRYE